MYVSSATVQGVELNELTYKLVSIDHVEAPAQGKIITGCFCPML